MFWALFFKEIHLICYMGLVERKVKRQHFYYKMRWESNDKLV